MVNREDIQATCDDIVREFAPLQVILFGSYAYGTPTENSDVDLLVIMDIPESETSRQAGEILQRIPRRFRMDLLVRSPEEIAYRISYNDWFLREITEKGDVLYKSTSFLPKPLKKEKGLMNPLTQEWAQKAERDYAAIALHQQAEDPDFDMICFHAQQCIEKYLKAWLQGADIPLLRSHDLLALLDMIVPTIPSWRAWQPDFLVIAPYAVEFRYPGKSATAEKAQHATRICSEVRQAIRSELKLPQNQTEGQA
ncbi:MAG: HEPN domain-containing protein [Candidatus Poribacteria bacterium]|nr:HEPN domain-containing protein [Candidatus Poribacteria bacterium]MDE0324439.1 HEPN domain-containing protein [Candidatus Poribacteria bacterium]